MKSYARWFGVDLGCALKELQLLGVELEPDYVAALRRTLEQPRQRRRDGRSEDTGLTGETDEHFAYIAGYTEGGAPYGITWEEWDELDEQRQLGGTGVHRSDPNPDWSMDTRRQTLLFRIDLRNVEPPVWRRIEVPASYNFWALHVAIQDSMGWFDSHLHAFRVSNPDTGALDLIGIPDDDPFDEDVVYRPGWEVPVRSYFQRPGDRAEYEYDFGDSWEHDVVLEAVRQRERGVKYPRCRSGARACPPEDCGGPWGYAELLTTIADPEHEEYASTLEWLGGRFNPETFDPDQVRFDNPDKRWRFAFLGE